MRTYSYFNGLRKDLYDKEKKNLPYISKKTFKDWTEDNEIEYSIAGRTALRAADDDDKVILAQPPTEHDTEKEPDRYVMKDYRLGVVTGYIPVGPAKFVELVNAWLIPLLIFLIAVAAALTVFLLWPKAPAEPETITKPVINRYIEEIGDENLNLESGATRYRFNTTMNVIQDTIQNINFENVNKGKLLRIMIKLHPEDEEYIYDSGLIPEGQKVTADVLLDHAPKGTYETIAECYSYNTDEEQQSQTNFEVKLVIQ